MEVDSEPPSKLPELRTRAVVMQPHPTASNPFYSPAATPKAKGKSLIRRALQTSPLAPSTIYSPEVSPHGSSRVAVLADQLAVTHQALMERE